ncbi:hypothetical protein PVA45_08650 (plasmid) [Entomospira entomophila]|uniref:Uncharacterized protein n=1 Tax=Entomospira entomophila TaxID=2719988 RepID=A0A968GAM7_9SPIO|nr:hypothetical protein [Entomospira entomophilus]NIZ41577.1 hypothetical protein [Entomospira entomophilus]WDI36470.1 hypothetical protein PVA45_08650 [Entomospira entomophilus]
MKIKPTTLTQEEVSAIKEKQNSHQVKSGRKIKHQNIVKWTLQLNLETASYIDLVVIPQVQQQRNKEGNLAKVSRADAIDYLVSIHKN